MEKVNLEKLTIRHTNGVIFSHSTLVDNMEDIFIMAGRGVDGLGREIISFDIKCSDGGVRTYSPEQLNIINTLNNK